MDRKETFFKDKAECKIPFTHIENNITEPALKEIDELYGAADVISYDNSKKHKRNLKFIAGIGTAITILFLLYDEAELHWFIFLCIILIGILFYMTHLAERTDCHRKYTEYRVFAETLRVHYFLSIAGIKEHVTIILPWFIKKSIPWINEILLSLPRTNATEKKPIINCWIRHQKEYHHNALIKTSKTKEKNDKFTRRALYVTLATYAAALLFEIYMLTIPSGEINLDALGVILKTTQDWGIMVGFDQVDMIRSILKIVIGSMSAFTLFIGSYYGKMSLSNAIEDHRRMVMLYEKAENEALHKGETDELILSLAHEFLIENSTWYSYQSKNSPDLILE